MELKEFLLLLGGFSIFILVFNNFYKNIRSKNFIFYLLSLFVAIWFFLMFIISLIPVANLVEIIFWKKIIYGSLIISAALTYHFVLSFTKYDKDKINFFLYFSYLASFIFILINCFDLFLNNFKIQKTRGDLGLVLLLIYLFFFLCSCLIVLIKYHKKTTTLTSKKQVDYMILGILTIFFSYFFCYFSLSNNEYYLHYYVLSLFSILIINYSLVSYQSINLIFIFRKITINLLAIIATVSFFYVFQDIYKEELLFKYQGYSDIIILTVAMLIFPYIKKYFLILADKRVFHSFYDSKELIAKLIQQFNTTMEIKKIYSSIGNIFIESFHNESIGILSYSEKNNCLKTKYSYNLNLKADEAFLVFDERKTKKSYINKNTPIIINDLKNENYDKYKEIIQKCSKLNIEIIAPLKTKNKLIGVIILSKKSFDNFYNGRDLSFLKTIADQSAMSLENSYLYEKAKKFNEKLAEEVEKATHNLRLANEELKKLDVAKSEFISIAAHQLRTPLTVIKGYSSMMLENLFGELSKEQKENLLKVYEANERLIRLVEDLLSISRIESGKLKLHFEITQLEITVESVVKELTKAASSKGLSLSYAKADKETEKVKIDPDKIRQVVMNLIDNSIKYTKEGAIVVKVETIKDKIRFTVKDTGLGIKKEDLANLFKKFSRGTGVSLVHTEGTGLGLYVAKMMIEIHQGKIWAESPGEGQGSSFCFELPIAKDEVIPKVDNQDLKNESIQ
jgi:signal transduction histidine kinase